MSIWHFQKKNGGLVKWGQISPPRWIVSFIDYKLAPSFFIFFAPVRHLLRRNLNHGNWRCILLGLWLVLDHEADLSGGIVDSLVTGPQVHDRVAMKEKSFYVLPCICIRPSDSNLKY